MVSIGKIAWVPLTCARFVWFVPFQSSAVSMFLSLLSNCFVTLVAALDFGFSASVACVNASVDSEINLGWLAD